MVFPSGTWEYNGKQYRIISSRINKNDVQRQLWQSEWNRSHIKTEDNKKTSHTHIHTNTRTEARAIFNLELDIS